MAIPSLDENIGLLGVLEIITLQNEGDRTYVGDLFEDPVNGGAARISLPDNALDVNLGHGFGPDGFAAVPGGVINKAPVLPGPSEMIYGYTVPYTGNDGGVGAALSLHRAQCDRADAGRSRHAEQPATRGRWARRSQRRNRIRCSPPPICPPAKSSSSGSPIFPSSATFPVADSTSIARSATPP